MRNKELELLLIEDNPSEARMLIGMLSKAHKPRFIVRHVQLLADGLGEIASRHFDVALVDLGLPDSQGLETALAVRSRARLLPIVILTVLDDEDAALTSLQMDIQEYLVKGEITGNLLTRSISYAIQRKLDVEALRQSEQRFSSFMLHMPAAAWLKDLEGHYLYLNAEAKRLFLKPAADLLGKTAEEVLAPELARAVTENHRRALTEAGTVAGLVCWPGADGSERWIYTHNFAIPGPSGAPVQVGVVALDVSGLKRAEEDSRQKDRLLVQQGRMAAMGEMLNNIAHQWRQPLNVLGLNMQELRISYRLGTFSEELLNTNVAHAMEILQHLSQTIDDFRDLTSPDKDKSLFSVEQVTAKTLSLVETGFKEGNIAIETSFSGDPQINGYPNEFGQVLLNILMNARDALLERGTAGARIAVRGWSEGGRTVVTVTDNAGGVSPELLEKIFDAYFTTKELGKGTGVGLFMSKKIIEQSMGGRLSVSNVADGAEFRIEV